MQEMLEKFLAQANAGCDTEVDKGMLYGLGLYLLAALKGADDVPDEVWNSLNGISRTLSLTLFVVSVLATDRGVDLDKLISEAMR